MPRTSFQGYAIYELPFGRGKTLARDANKIVNAVIGGWSVSPIFIVRSGWPMPVYNAADESGTFGRGARANCNSIPSITGETQSPEESVASSGSPTPNNFTNPVAGTFGNCSPQLGKLRGRGTPTWDLSLHKDFPLTERFKLQFRSDFINAFNHVQLNAPEMSLGGKMGQITSAQPPRNIQFSAEASNY